MMKRLVFLPLLFFWVVSCWAQAPSLPVAGDWDKKHADEASVELINSYQADLQNDGSYTETVHRTTRIQNERGMDSEGEISFFYDRKHQVVKKLVVVLTDPNGKKHHPRMVQDVDSGVEGTYSDNRKKIVTMPNVVPGSVIDFQLVIFNRQDAIKGEFFLSPDFFSATPFKHKIVTLTAPESKRLYFKEIHTTKKPAVTRQKGRVTYSWEMKEDEGYDPEILKEAATPPPIDFLPQAFVSTLPSWSAFSRWYVKEFFKNVVVSPEIIREVGVLTRGKLTLVGKVEALAAYLHDNFRYVAMNLDAHNFEPHPSNEVFKNKFGDCKDQSVLFVAMLKVLGLEAYPVLVRDASLGDFSGLLPDPGCFNHVIVVIKLDGKTFFVDPLAEGYRMGELPLALEGAWALIVDGKNGEVLRLPFVDIKQKTSVTHSRIRLEADGSAFIETAMTFDRQNSIDKRRDLKLMTKQDKKALLEYLENLTHGGKVVEYAFVGQDDPTGFLTVKVKTQNPQLVKPKGPFLIFAETGEDFTSFFPEKERKYPLWLESESQDVAIEEYAIPAGFSFVYVPPAVHLTSECLDIDVVTTASGRGIRQETRRHTKRALIPPERYKDLKDFLIRAGRALDECVIIRKKS